MSPLGRKDRKCGGREMGNVAGAQLVGEGGGGFQIRVVAGPD